LKPRKLVGMEDLDFSKGGGLIPVIVQDCESLKVLTLAYLNREALEKTVETGYAHFFRRSFGKTMKKGETSGNVQEVKEIRADCDYDAVLYLVKPAGPACHLGEETCFHNELKEKHKEQE
jgi:phosphoribosyl-AMP cyclohydrolase